MEDKKILNDEEPKELPVDELEKATGGEYISPYYKIVRAVNVLFNPESHIDESMIDRSSTFLKDNPLGGLEHVEDFSDSDDM